MSSDFLKIRVRHSDQEIHFKINKNTNLGKIMTTFAEKLGSPIGILRFLYDGKRLQKTDTAKKMGIKDQDVIDVYMLQDGGGIQTDSQDRLKKRDILKTSF